MTTEEMKKTVSNLRTKVTGEALFDVINLLDRVWEGDKALLKSLTTRATTAAAVEQGADQHELINQTALAQAHKVSQLDWDQPRYAVDVAPLRSYPLATAEALFLDCVKKSEGQKPSQKLGQAGINAGHMYRVLNPFLGPWDMAGLVECELRFLTDLITRGHNYMAFRLQDDPNAKPRKAWWEDVASKPMSPEDPVGSGDSIMVKVESVPAMAFYESYQEGNGFAALLDHPSRPLQSWYDTLCVSLTDLTVNLLMR